MRIFAFIYGIIFCVAGVLGFVPQLAPALRLNFELNALHITTGVAAFVVGFIGRLSSRIYFKVIGILFAALAVVGFVDQKREILGLFASNATLTWFHVITAVPALILGFGARD